MLGPGTQEQGSPANGDLLRAYQEASPEESLVPEMLPPPPLAVPEGGSESSLLQGLSDIPAPPHLDEASSPPRKGSSESTQVVRKCRRHAKSSTCNMVSALYGKMAVVATAVLVLTEVMENSIPLLSFHGYLYAYLMGGSVVCLLGVYISMMVDKCPSLSGQPPARDSQDPEIAATNRKTMLTCSDVSIYLRVGMLVFGLGTLISCGLEIATIFTIPKPCTDPVNLAMPVLHALFAFLQMHFLFINSQRVAKSLGCLRHLVLMHLVATNVAVWLKLLLWETSSEWLRQNHVEQAGQIIWPPKGFNFTTHIIDDKGEHKVFFTSDCLWRPQENVPMERMLTLQRCLHNSTIGAIWKKAAPFLSPFIVQYSVIGMVVIYTLWDNFSYCTKGNNRDRRHSSSSGQTDADSGSGSFRIIDCQSSSKGLFLGLLVLIAGIIVLILFFVLSNENMEVETLSAVTALHCTIQGISVLATAIGLCRIGDTHHKRRRMTQLNAILQGIGVLAVYTYGIFGVVVGASRIWDGSEHVLLLMDGAFMVLFASLQSVFIQRVAASVNCSKKYKNHKPGLQVVTFLMFSNLVLWLLETFTNQNHISSQQQLSMFGAISWGIISRLALPLVIFYRFHSCVFLIEAWRQSTDPSRDQRS